MSEYTDVGEFHKKFGLRHGHLGDVGPVPIDPELMQFRINFLQEELDEFIDGANSMDHGMMADALIDLVYVAIGTAHLFGYPWNQLWGDVQRANMTKMRATTTTMGPRKNATHDVIKPEGWRGPDTDEILRSVGFI